ncbi:glycoside hydrolase family 2 TIM barrel-domain containing protein [Arthrobacter sp. W4I7]|uniref:glycoside hydrolase family 2 protein n=1 Tax=Arthrobacter sp. W4I7 TaxID=3042296 RepID=UPI002786D051|nr:glycoside hydrolase family 2 TIM barrel-domain containing protein [Arthrobacter sp. W4I7]MDQ0691288.1 beta-galactosidase [Arthrobacter sp. W4I7]
MQVSFNNGWSVRPWASIFAALGGGRPQSASVTLPHDAVLDLDRTAAGKPEQAYFPGGAFEYTKTFDVPEEWRNKRVSVVFEGVYRDAMVFVNGAFAAQRPYGYSAFTVPLDPYLRYGETNTIRVDARVHDDSRWYSGGGIYRDTHLVVADLVHLAYDGVVVTTPDIEDDLSTVEVAVTVTNESTATDSLRIDVRLEAPGGVVCAEGTAPVTVLAGESAVTRLRLYLPAARRWTVDHPHLYRAVVTASRDNAEVDQASVNFGIRKLQLDPVHGLRINGEVVLLRGACIHHDNGILGAASIGRAEERRIELLKAAGFNAIRSAHYPASSSLLDACDRIGMLVIDEAFDMWAQGKSAFDYSLAFADWWERDIEAMIVKDRNHPSVIMYSIGNEIPETGDLHGSALGRRLAEKVRSLDNTRYVTNGINGIVSALEEVMSSTSRESAAGVNDVLGDDTGIANPMNAADFITRRTEESFSVLDVAGMNYGEARYEMDRALFPNRVIVGSENFVAQIALGWDLVERLSHVIGDFTWTGFDYVGEVGLGRHAFADEKDTFLGAFPWVAAWCGDLDLTGYRRPQSYYREIVFGLATGPYIAVLRPTERERVAQATQWAWTDSAGSWSWDVAPWTPLSVEVYADADEVELILNGTSLGRMRAGRDAAFRSAFTVPYEPGELIAVAYSDGRELGRSALRSAHGMASLQATPDRTRLIADDRDLAFVALELRDPEGTLITCDDRELKATVTGSGVLQGFGSARPVTIEGYRTGTHSTFEGRALAVVRPTGPGPITLHVAGVGLADVTVTLRADPPSTAGLHERAGRGA